MSSGPRSNRSIHTDLLPMTGQTLQIFNIETKQEVKSHVNDSDVVFWKWISDKTIDTVTEVAVFHWSTDDQTSPPSQ